MAVLTVNGVDLPTPTDMEIGIQDLSKSSRNTKGNMLIERINTKAKIDLQWKFLSAADTAKVLTAVSGASFSVTYSNPVTNAVRTANFYCGDRKAPVMDIKNEVTRYKDVKFNLIEL